MPVNVDKNLTLNNNTMDASYGELFTKLNKAYAWTHTQSTSSGGTAVILVNDGDILTTMASNDIDKCSCAEYDRYGGSGGYAINRVIIDGKIYQNINGTLTQRGTKTNYKQISGTIAIDDEGKLWNVSATETQLGTESKWEIISAPYSAQPGYYCGLCDGKIYLINGTETPTRLYSSIENVIKLKAKGSYPNGYCITDNGTLYYLNNNIATIIGSDKIWIDILYLGNTSTSTNLPAYVKTSDGDVYAINQTSTMTKINVDNIKEAANGVCITTDGKMYKNITSNSPQDISNGITWTSMTDPVSNITYAIGDNKLYKVNTSTPTYTQIGTEENYQKIDGLYKSTYSNNLALAWTGDAISITHTIFTTKSPQINDATYIDEDLNQYSTILSVGGTTVSDKYRTYTRDVTRDSSFTAIPPATIRETVSTVDFLRITNPNT